MSWRRSLAVISEVVVDKLPEFPLRQFIDNNFRDYGQRSPPAHTAVLPQADHKCNRSAFCPCAIFETGQCDENGFPACDRRRLPPQAPAAAVPTTNLCPDSTDSVLRESCVRLASVLLQTQPSLSTDDSQAHCFDMEPETRPARGVFCLWSLQ